MLKYGEWQTLEALRRTEHGMYLCEAGLKGEQVLLPKKQVADELNVGDAIDVFVYKDSEDRPVATLRNPLITMRQFAMLEVVSVTQIGAFLDWGLEKDLFLPFREQTVPVQKGNSYLVGLYLDKSNRLCATMRLYHRLESRSPYRKDQQVTGVIYDKSPEFGYFVAVSNRFSGLIPKREAFGKLYIGKEVVCRVVQVEQDGRLTLAVREKIPDQITADAVYLLSYMKDHEGQIPFTDKAAPEVISSELSLSKAGFKRAVGRLLRERRIRILDDRIELV